MDKYKEALERARKCLKDGTITNTAKSYIEAIFPELCESENEKTRKEIVGYLKKNLRLEWATWLEKQGKKSTDEMIEALRTEYEKGRADAITESLLGVKKTPLK